MQARPPASPLTAVSRCHLHQRLQPGCKRCAKFKDAAKGPAFASGFCRSVGSFWLVAQKKAAQLHLQILQMLLVRRLVKFELPPNMAGFQVSSCTTSIYISIYIRCISYLSYLSFCCQFFGASPRPKNLDPKLLDPRGHRAVSPK